MQQMSQCSRSSTIRDINRQIVLNYVRELGPISRAEIARETALQRSTVSLIVEELKAEELIEERPDDSRDAGTKQMTYLGSEK